jgi:cellobiose transport system permease protein
VLFLWELAFFRRDLGEASAVAILLFLLIVGIGVINFLISRRISTGDAPKNRAARRRARTAGAAASAAAAAATSTTLATITEENAR